MRRGEEVYPSCQPGMPFLSFSRSLMNGKREGGQLSRPWLYAGVATVWLLLITILHLWLNFDHEEKKIIKMGYMPVITNLAAPLLDHASRKRTDIHFQALKFNSFAEMADALRNDQIQAAFIIAPLAVVLHQQSGKVKVVYIGNRHESTFVVKKDLRAQTLDDLPGKTIAVPTRYSGHNLALLRMMEDAGLTARINVVELNPPDMPSALMTGAIDGYFVGEPFAAQSLKDGDARVLFRVEEVWNSFICNLVIVKEDLLEKEPEMVQQLVSGAVRSGLWARKNPEQAARIVSRYWNQPLELVLYAMTTPENRIVYDQFLPRGEELQEIADLMVHFDLLKESGITGLVDDRYARTVRLDHLDNLEDIFQ